MSNDPLWQFVHDEVGVASRALKDAEKTLWGVFGIPKGSPERERRIRVAKEKVEQARNALAASDDADDCDSRIRKLEYLLADSRRNEQRANDRLEQMKAALREQSDD